MQHLKLICDVCISDAQIITEQKNQNTEPIFKIRSQMLVAETVNSNKRIYPNKLLKEAVDCYVENYVNNSIAIGEMGHPASPRIDYDRACHKVLSLVQEGDAWIGTSQILTGTPKGDLLFGLLKNNVRVGFSSRGIGHITESNVIDAYVLKAIDCVSDNSAPGCFTDGILESKDYVINEHGDIVEIKFEEFQTKLKTLSINSVERRQKLIDITNQLLQSL